MHVYPEGNAWAFIHHAPRPPSALQVLPRPVAVAWWWSCCLSTAGAAIAAGSPPVMLKVLPMPPALPFLNWCLFCSHQVLARPVAAAQQWACDSMRACTLYPSGSTLVFVHCDNSSHVLASPPPSRYSQGLWQLPGGGLAPLSAAGAAIAAGSPPIMLKVKDWPPKKDFAVSLPRHFMVRAMPTHAQEADRQPNNWLFPGPTAPLHCVVNADNSCSEQLAIVTVTHVHTPLICTAPLATKLTAAGQS